MGLRIITFKIDPQALDMLDHIARIEGVPRSEIIREAIELYVKAWMKMQGRPVEIKAKREKWRVKVIKLV